MLCFLDRTLRFIFDKRRAHAWTGDAKNFTRKLNTFIDMVTMTTLHWFAVKVFLEIVNEDRNKKHVSISTCTFIIDMRLYMPTDNYTVTNICINYIKTSNNCMCNTFCKITKIVRAFWLLKNLWFYCAGKLIVLYLKLFYKSNRPHFLWVYQRRRGNPLRSDVGRTLEMLVNHSPSARDL